MAHVNEGRSCGGEFEANVSALLASGAIDLGTAARWRSLALDGSLPAPSSPPSTAQPDSEPETRARDQASRTRSALLSMPVEERAPMVVVGLERPWLALAALEGARSRDPAPSFRRRLLLVEEDESALVRGLGSADVRALAEDGACLWLTGPGAGRRVLSWASARLSYALPESVLVSVGVSGASASAARLIGEGLASLRATQSERLAALSARLAERYPWPVPARVGEGVRAAARGERGLRFLLIGSLNTTYVRHALEDLGAALEALGHEARISMEPDHSTKATALSVLEAVEAFEPDQVICVNHARATLGEAVPEGLPVLCWVQDAMSHLYDRRQASASKPEDFWFGVVHASMAERFGYPAYGLYPFPVPASARKFHAGEVDEGRRDRFACEVAFVSHHGEAPERLRAELADRLGPGEAASRLMECLWARAHALVEAGAETPVIEAIEPAAREAFAEAVGREPDAGALARAARCVLLPLAGRIARHRAARWAAEIAEARGWRLRLYGRGWETNDWSAAFAAGPVDHGEDLRACYACARVHLHVDLATLTHQRVFECAMSGGLPALAMIGGALAPPGDDSGLSEGVRRHYIDHFHHERILGDLSDVVFADRAGLERVLTRAVEDEGWRSARSARMGDGARAIVSTDAFCERMLAHLGFVYTGGDESMLAGPRALASRRVDSAA